MDSNLILLVVLVLFSGVFSASETALVSLTTSKVDELVGEKVKNAKLLKKLKSDPYKLLITVLIGNNIVNIGASAYAAVVFIDIFGSSGVGIATGVMTFLILIFGEIVPKAFAQEHAVGLSLLIARPIYVLQLILFPFIWFFRKIVKLASKFFGNRNSQTVTEGELMAMVKIGAKEGSIEKQERELIENVLEFNDIEVDEVMTPRVAIEAMDQEWTLGKAIKFVIKHSHSRIPIYKENLDEIVGIVSIKDLLKFSQDFSTRKKLKNLPYSIPLEVPLSKKINDLFREFQRKHVHLAIVIDEHGGTAGLVSLEDLLEEIVGDIEDEFDVKELPIEIVDSKNIIASGKVLVEDINDFFKMKIAGDEHQSINTFVTDHLHRFPREGETIKFPRVRMKILKMEKNIIEKVKITKLRKKSTS